MGILLVLGLVLGLGVVLGLKGKITVYYDAKDVGFTFVMSVLVVAFLMFPIGAVRIGIVIAELLLGLKVISSTFKDNRSIWKFPLALYTKLAMSTILLWNLFNAFTSKSKESSQIIPGILGKLLITGVTSILILKLINKSRNPFIKTEETVVNNESSDSYCQIKDSQTEALKDLVLQTQMKIMLMRMELIQKYGLENFTKSPEYLALLPATRMMIIDPRILDVTKETNNKAKAA
jgi:hypothetical protein